MGRIFSSRVLGVIFIGLIALGIWFVYAVFAQTFISFDRVMLTTESVGLQLPKRADVKVRGVIVGEVLESDSDLHGAKLTLGIKPAKIKKIPSNVTATILPKTLFGEKYVELVIPDEKAPRSLRAGDRITETVLPIEVEQVLHDIYPLLRAVQPAELNYTLNAVAGALEGRGNEIGQSIETLDSYLKRLNPQIPALIEDLRLLADVSGTYATVMPQVAEVLRNTVKTGGTLKGKEGQLNAFLKEMTQVANTTDQFLDDNGDNFVRVGQLIEPTAALLKRYAPQFPCMFEGLTKQVPMLANTFRGFIFHIDVVLLPKQPRGYGPQDVPVFGATNPPNCAGLPNPKVPFKGVPNFDDGVNNLGRGDNQRVAPGFDADRVAVGNAAGTAEKLFLGSLAAPVLGVPGDEVPDLSSLLLGPLLVGTEVSVR